MTEKDYGELYLGDPGDEVPLPEEQEFEILAELDTRPEELGDPAEAERYRKWLAARA